MLKESARSLAESRPARDNAYVSPEDPGLGRLGGFGMFLRWRMLAVVQRGVGVWMQGYEGCELDLDV